MGNILSKLFKIMLINCREANHRLLHVLQKVVTGDISILREIVCAIIMMHE